MMRSNRCAEQARLVGHLSLAETEQIEGDLLAEDNGCNHINDMLVYHFHESIANTCASHFDATLLFLQQ